MFGTESELLRGKEIVGIQVYRASKYIVAIGHRVGVQAAIGHRVGLQAAISQGWGHPAT